MGNYTSVIVLDRAEMVNYDWLFLENVVGASVRVRLGIF